MSAQTDSTRIEIRTRKGVEIMFNVDNSTDKTVKTGVITHRFNRMRCNQPRIQRNRSSQ